MTRRSTVLLASMLLYAAACALPALVLHDRHYADTTHWAWGGYRNIRGLTLLSAGLLFGVFRFNFTAFANLPLWLGWVQLSRGKQQSARQCAAISLLMSIETLQLAVQPYIYDEGAATRGFLSSLHIGFFLWIGSMAVLWLFSERQLQERQQETLAPLAHS